MYTIFVIILYAIHAHVEVLWDVVVCWRKYKEWWYELHIWQVKETTYVLQSIYQEVETGEGVKQFILIPESFCGGGMGSTT